MFNCKKQKLKFYTNQSNTRKNKIDFPSSDVCKIHAGILEATEYYTPKLCDQRHRLFISERAKWNLTSIDLAGRVYWRSLRSSWKARRKPKEIRSGGRDRFVRIVRRPLRLFLRRNNESWISLFPIFQDGSSYSIWNWRVYIPHALLLMLQRQGLPAVRGTTKLSRSGGLNMPRYAQKT